jgi:hypothetical protein
MKREKDDKRRMSSAEKETEVQADNDSLRTRSADNASRHHRPILQVQLKLEKVFSEGGPVHVLGTRMLAFAHA